MKETAPSIGKQYAPNGWCFWLYYVVDFIIVLKNGIDGSEYALTCLWYLRPLSLTLKPKTNNATAEIVAIR